MNLMKKMCAALLCALMLAAALPASVSAATTATTRLTIAEASYKDASVMTISEKSDKSFTLALVEGVYEHGPSWDLSVDVGKVPYLIIQADLDMINRSDIQIKLNGVVVASVLKSGWLVLELKNYASGGIFNGSVQVFMRDYYYAASTGGRGKRSVNTVKGVWLSQSKDLDGKVDKSKLNKIVPRLDITKKTVLKYDDGITPYNVLTEKVDEYGFDMWIDPDQEIEYYKHYGAIHWDVTVDLNKTPYICVDLAELETAFCLIIFVQDENDAYADNMPYPYILAGSGGLQVYDLKTDLGKRAGKFTGKQNLRIAVLVDDGRLANGNVNYIKQIWFDTKNPQTSSPPSKNETSLTTGSQSGTDVSHSLESASENSAAVTDSSSAAESGSAGASAPGGNAGMIAVIVIACVAVLAGGGAAVYFLLLKKRGWRRR